MEEYGAGVPHGLGLGLLLFLIYNQGFFLRLKLNYLLITTSLRSVVDNIYESASKLKNGLKRK